MKVVILFTPITIIIFYIMEDILIFPDINKKLADLIVKFDSYNFIEEQKKIEIISKFLYDDNHSIYDPIIQDVIICVKLNILCFMECRSALILLRNENLFYPMTILNRSILERWALINYLKVNFQKYLCEEGKNEKYKDRIKKIMEGTKLKEHFPDLKDSLNTINIMENLRELDNGDENKTNMKNYAILSEWSHPNFMGNMVFFNGGSFVSKNEKDQLESFLKKLDFQYNCMVRSIQEFKSLINKILRLCQNALKLDQI